MSVFRRRRAEQERTPTPPPSNSNPEEPQAFTPLPEPAVQPAQLEKAFIALTAKVQDCIDRLDSLEHRIDELSESTMNSPSHSDVLEVRLHSAKLAAELARATVELRGEIGMASDEARRAARLARAADNSDPALALPVDVDLTDVRIAERRRDDSNTGSGKGLSETA